MYKYKDFEKWLKTEEGQRKTLLKAVELSKDKRLKEGCKFSECLGLGDSWENMALIHRLEELGFVSVKHSDGWINDDIIRWIEK